MRRLARVALVLVLCLAGGAALSADDWTNQLRFGVGYFAPTSDDEGTIAYAVYPTYPLARTKGSVDNVLGVYVAFEHKFNQLLGLEGSIGYFKPDFEFEISDLDGANPETFSEGGEVIPLGVALNFHLLKDSKVDLYVGPVIAYMMYDDVETRLSDVERLKIEFEDEVAYGAQVGVDWPFSPKWGISFKATYLSAKAEPDKITYFADIPPVEAVGGFSEELVVTHDFSPNPIVLSVTAGYKF